MLTLNAAKAATTKPVDTFILLSNGVYLEFFTVKGTDSEKFVLCTVRSVEVLFIRTGRSF